MKSDFLVIVGLSLLALFIWLRDVNWMLSADDTLPVLAAIPIFVWIGSPWNFRKDPRPLSLGGLCAFVGFFLFGILFNSTLFLAIGWTTLLWAWINANIEPEKERYLEKLLVLPLMAFPWISLDFDFVGWWFRLSGAWTTAKLFHLFGYAASQEGTNIVINNLTVNVEIACAGLNALQSMLIAGTVVDYIILGSTNRYWINIPIIVVVSWIANTLRIIGVSIAGLYFSPEFAMGAFHQVGGWMILVIVFCLCWLLFTLQEPQRKKHGE
jgi:exosortase